jgi:trans-aconitate 2-methyltransferase
MPWNPDVYNNFKEERSAPFDDLLKLVVIKPGLSVIDLGCGTGELTHRLSEHLPDANVLGIDSSAEMLKKADDYTTDNCIFKQQDIEAVLNEDRKWDLVFSNAALQWIDDHHTLIPRVIAMVRSGGQLAIQVPSNHDHYTHIAIKELAAADPYRQVLRGWTRTAPVLKIEVYAKILFDNGAKSITVFEKAYPHVLENAAGLVRWTSGTALIPYLEKLPKDLHNSFISEYKHLLETRFPESPIFYPFKRILMSATF